MSVDSRCTCQAPCPPGWLVRGNTTYDVVNDACNTPCVNLRGGQSNHQFPAGKCTTYGCPLWDGLWRDPTTGGIYLHLHGQLRWIRSPAVLTDCYPKCGIYTFAHGALSRCARGPDIADNCNCPPHPALGGGCGSPRRSGCGAPTPAPPPRVSPPPGAKPAPLAVTTAATAIGLTSAVLNGMANDSGFSAAGGGTTFCDFNLGTTPTLDTPVAASNPHFTVYDNSERATVTGLTPNTTYYFQIATQNAWGTTYGAVLSFITLMPTTTTPDPVPVPTPSKSSAMLPLLILAAGGIAAVAIASEAPRRAEPVPAGAARRRAYSYQRGR